MFAYQELIDDGWTRHEADDKNFKNHYGFDCFWLELQLSKKRYLSWRPEEGIMKLMIHENHFVECKIPIKSKDEYKLLLRTFNK